MSKSVYKQSLFTKLNTAHQKECWQQNTSKFPCKQTHIFQSSMNRCSVKITTNKLYLMKTDDSEFYI